MHSLDSHSNLIDDYYLSKIAWKLSYFSPSLKALFLHILALCKISDHAVTWFDDGADASPSQGNKDCPRVFFVSFGFMWEFASLTVAPSFSMAYCSGLTQHMIISQSSMFICLAYTWIELTFCEFHGMYVHLLVHFVINNVYLCFAVTAWLFGESGFILERSGIRLVSNCLWKPGLVLWASVSICFLLFLPLRVMLAYSHEHIGV